MKRLVMAMLLASLPSMAQEDRIQKLVMLKYAEPQAVANLISVFGAVQVRVDNRMKVISLNGPKENVTVAEAAIKQLDVPGAAQKNIDLTVYFLVGSDSDKAAGNPPPADLQGVVTQLKNTFPFKSYLMLDVLSLRARAGVGAETSGQLSGSRITTFKVRSASLDGDGNNVRLDGLHAGVKVPVSAGEGKITYIDTGISTDVVDVKEGQKLVVGRSSLDGPGTALFLILIAKSAN